MFTATSHLSLEKLRLLKNECIEMKRTSILKVLVHLNQKMNKGGGIDTGDIGI